MARYRVPTPKPDQISVVWGKADSFASPSLVYVYPDRDGKSDCRVLMEAIEEPRHRTGETRRSLAAELEARGYDLTTLRITIRRKQKEPAHD